MSTLASLYDKKWLRVTSHMFSIWVSGSPDVLISLPWWLILVQFTLRHRVPGVLPDSCATHALPHFDVLVYSILCSDTKIPRLWGNGVHRLLHWTNHGFIQSLSGGHIREGKFITLFDFKYYFLPWSHYILYPDSLEQLLCLFWLNSFH